MVGKPKKSNRGFDLRGSFNTLEWRKENSWRILKRTPHSKYLTSSKFLFSISTYTFCLISMKKWAQILKFKFQSFWIRLLFYSKFFLFFSKQNAAFFEFLPFPKTFWLNFKSIKNCFQVCKIHLWNIEVFSNGFANWILTQFFCFSSNFQRWNEISKFKLIFLKCTLRMSQT